jgi:hypothetical protein
MYWNLWSPLKPVKPSRREKGRIIQSFEMIPQILSITARMDAWLAHSGSFWPRQLTEKCLSFTHSPVTKQEIEEHFNSHGSGKITEIKLMSGFGFIEYEDAMDARDVVPGKEPTSPSYQLFAQG